MECILENADKIMERVLGKIETGESNDRKENSISTTDDSAISNSPIDLKMQDGASPLKWTSKILTSKTNLGEMLRENNVDGDLDDKASLETEGKKNRSAQKARFSALAEEYENFEVDSNHQSFYMKPKEAFMKGTSPRLSVGEVASLKLDSVQEESRRIRFAYPLAATSVWDDDSAMYSTIIFTKEDQENMSSDEYGAHTFMKKLRCVHQSHLILLLHLHQIWLKRRSLLENQWSQNFHSSEPQTEDSKTVVSKWAVIDSVKAKTIAFQQKLDNTHIKIPTPKSVAGVQFHDSVTPSCPVGIQTQWRGGNNTPVICSNPAQLTKVNIRANNLKNLKNRWEETNSAVKMVTSVTNISPPRSAKKKFLECSQSSSPVAKSLRYEQEDLFENAESSQQNTKKSLNLDIVSHKDISHTNETGMAEEYSADNEVSSDEMDMSQNVSRFIDKAFDFMDRSPTKSFETPCTTTQEEFTSLMNDTSSENVMENHSTLVTSNTALIDQETNDSSGNAIVYFCFLACRLPYTVSFYRKRLREKRVEDGSCQKIELTSNIANIPTQHVIGGVHQEEDKVDIENNKATLEREITVQQQRIAQASRALRYCKEQLEFRGSREEVDAQRALLIATETRRALIFEIEKLNREEIKRFGALEFNHYLTLKNLPPDFVCTLEVYGLRTRREQISHEEKYRLKGTAGRSKAQKMSTLASGGGPLAVVDPSFQLIGRLSLDIQSASRKMFTLQDPLHPLDGGIMVKIKKYATDKTNLSHRGFLSMYQRTKEGLGSWTRYWCVLNCGEMKFWRSPEDDANNKEIGHVQRQGCVKPEMEKLRVMLAADTKNDLQVWLDMINQTARHLLMWDRHSSLAKLVLSAVVVIPYGITIIFILLIQIASMSLVKETYNAVRSRERISFGGFRFVIPSESFAVPKFACCEGKHDGVIEEDRCNFDNSFNLANCANEVQNLIGRNPSFERITSIPFPVEKEMDFSELQELSDSRREQNSKNTAGSHATTASVNDGTTLHKSIISEDKPIGDIVVESDSEEIIFRDYSSDNILLDVTVNMHGQFRGFLKDDGDQFDNDIVILIELLVKKNYAQFLILYLFRESILSTFYVPDYTKLCSLRRDYGTPKVPIIALTATATPKIVTDTRDHLSIPNSKLFISSFVRTNLKYDLIPKASKTLISVVEKMKQLYPGKSGIIYCLSRKECETVASSLIKAGMSADVYHAGLADKARIDVQHRWLANRVDVICATIAFGMGIDKPDVRFVIHFSLPKSIEGYYQETGRAGRDGLPSYCLMLYSYQDSIRLRRMIEGGLFYISRYTTHKLVVGRYKKNPSSIRLFDVSEEARLVLTAMSRMNNITLRYLAELYRGQMIKKNSEQAMRLGHNSLPFFGRGNGMSEQDALRFMRKLVVEGYILERIYTTKFENTVAYAELTDKGRGVSTGHITSKVYLHITTGDSRRKSSSIEMINMNAVSEAQALKEKHMVKHGDVFTRCLRALTDVISEMAEQARLPGPYSILSREGIEQIAALLPRTNSDLLQADTMTAGKVDRYGAKIMTTLKPFWKEVDECDEAEMRKQLERLKKSEEVMGGFAPAPHSIVPPLSSLGDNRKFAPRFGRGGATKGRVIRATPKLRKKTSGGSQQSSVFYLYVILCIYLLFYDGQTDFHSNGSDWRSITLPHCIISVRKAAGYVEKFDPIATWRGNDTCGEYQMPKCVISVKKRAFSTCSEEILYNPSNKYARGYSLEMEEEKLGEEYRSFTCRTNPNTAFSSQQSDTAIIQLTPKSAERTCCCAYCGKFTKHAVRFTKVGSKRRRHVHITKIATGVLYLCRAHFSASDFQLVSGRVRLNPQAIPVPNSNCPDDPMTDDIDGHSDDDAIKELGITENQVSTKDITQSIVHTLPIVSEPSTHVTQFMKPSTSNPWSFYPNMLDVNSNYMGMSGYMNFPMSLSMAPIMSFSRDLNGIQQLEQQMLAQRMSIPLQPNIGALLRGDVIQPISGPFSACISDISQLNNEYLSNEVDSQLETDGVLAEQITHANSLHTVYTFNSSLLCIGNYNNYF
uniref:DNA 3'-5' helicase n=1 Tax=Heterorhabditis bacteriophora TaxID=37862 RepID=A0A1I7WC35_HETBA